MRSILPYAKAVAAFIAAACTALASEALPEEYRVWVLLVGTIATTFVVFEVPNITE